MKKTYLIYIPLILVLGIQYFDKNDTFLFVQYLLLALMIILVIIKFMKKN
jgi:hypothetical protein